MSCPECEISHPEEKCGRPYDIVIIAEAVLGRDNLPLLPMHYWGIRNTATGEVGFYIPRNRRDDYPSGTTLKFLRKEIDIILDEHDGAGGEVPARSWDSQEHYVLIAEVDIY
jgi:hypothetical protein